MQAGCTVSRLTVSSSRLLLLLEDSRHLRKTLEVQPACKKDTFRAGFDEIFYERSRMKAKSSFLIKKKKRFTSFMAGFLPIPTKFVLYS